jgi:predicted dehydrogenase
MGDTGVDETFSGMMHYSGDRVAQFTCSFRSPWHTLAEIVGTEGRLSVTRPFVNLDEGRLLTFYPDGKNPVVIPVPEQALYLGEFDDMNDAILDGGANYLSLEESLKHIRTTLALYQSARQGQVEYLSG